MSTFEVYRQRRAQPAPAECAAGASWPQRETEEAKPPPATGKRDETKAQQGVRQGGAQGRRSDTSCPRLVPMSAPLPAPPAITPIHPGRERSTSRIARVASRQPWPATPSATPAPQWTTSLGRSRGLLLLQPGGLAAGSELGRRALHRTNFLDVDGTPRTPFPEDSPPSLVTLQDSQYKSTNSPRT